MVAGFDPGEAFGLGDALEERLEFTARAVWIVSALDKNLGLGAAFEIIHIAEARGEAGHEQEFGALDFAAEPGDDAGAEGETRQRERQMVISRAQPGEGGPRVLDFADQIAVLALAAVHAPKIETQHGRASAAQSTGKSIDDFVVHRAAVKGMRMTDQRCERGRLLLGLFKERFEASGGTWYEVSFDASGHDLLFRLPAKAGLDCVIRLVPDRSPWPSGAPIATLGCIGDIAMFSRSLLVDCAAALVLAGSGWAQMQPPAGQTQPTQNPGGPPMGPPQGTTPGSAGGLSQDQQIDPYSTDKNFLRNVAESSATEADLGKIAQEKASNDSVKGFGKQMVDASTQTGRQLQRAAAALKVDLPAGTPRKAKKDEGKLAKLSGADFDQAYAKMAADEQKRAVKEFEQEAKNGKSPALKDYAAKNLPAEQEREKQAEALNTGEPAPAKPETRK